MNKDINAIGIVRQMVADGQISQEVAEKYFPELKESEDEKTKRLLHTIANKISQHLRDIFTEEEFQCFDAWSNAWLEKQGEQKHKIQPKFKIGDIIRFKGNETLKGETETHKIVSYDNELYVFADGTTDLFCEQDLYELVEQKPILDVEIPFGAKDSELEEVSYYIPKGYHAEIEDNKVILRKGEKKSSWSEEDEMQLDAAIHLVSNTGHIETTNWLKDIKNRVQLQPRQEYDDMAYEMARAVLYDKLKDSLSPQSQWRPSDKQLDSLYDVLNPCDGFNREVLESLYQDLKKLKE